MSQDNPKTMEELIRACNLGWMIDSRLHQGDVLPELKKLLERAEEEARRRGHGFDFSEECLVATFAQSPQSVKAFLQALVSTRNPQMLVMAWRMIQGAAIVSVEMSYKMQQEFDLRVNLFDEKADEPYKSSDVFDFALLRHIGIAKYKESPLFQGFYALRLTDRKLSSAPT